MSLENEMMKDFLVTRNVGYLGPIADRMREDGRDKEADTFLDVWSVPTVTKFDELLGNVAKKVIGKVGDDELTFEMTDGKRYQFYHRQD